MKLDKYMAGTKGETSETSKAPDEATPASLPNGLTITLPVAPREAAWYIDDKFRAVQADVSRIRIELVANKGDSPTPFTSSIRYILNGHERREDAIARTREELLESL